jgi:acyl-CoA thioesterase-1
MRKRFAITPVHVAVAIVAVMLTYKFWPWRGADVANLDSSGTNVIAFGDSLTAGYGAPEGDDYPSKLSSLIGTPVINAGVSGDTTETALARIDDVLSRNPRMVIVGLGGNDFLRRVPIETTRRNLESIVGQIQGAGAMVVLLGFRFPTLGPDYGDMYEEVADARACLLVPDVLDGILNDPKLKSDEIHPNAAGYALMAERVAEPAAKLLERANAR